MVDGTEIPPKPYHPVGSIRFRGFLDRVIVLGEPEWHVVGTEHLPNTYTGLPPHIPIHEGPWWEAACEFWCIPIAVRKTSFSTWWEPRWWKADTLGTVEQQVERISLIHKNAIDAAEKEKERNIGILLGMIT